MQSSADYVDVILERAQCTLASVIEGGALALPRIRHYLGQALAALAHVHAQGILHGDVKPDNFLVFCDGVKLADFGLAKPARREHRFVVSAVGYRAPEVLFGDKAYGCASDMWSLGCVFYDMAMGRHLLEGSSPELIALSMCRKLGTPTPETMPGCELLAHWRWLPKFRRPSDALLPLVFPLDAHALLNELLDFDKARRITAVAAGEHLFFKL